jgi:HSP20 family protein
MTREIPSAQMPVNIYQEGDRLMVAALLPGMEPPSIRVEVRGRSLTIYGQRRGPGQDRTQQHLLFEWTAGPYRRTLDLPAWVDVQKANATYDNGVLVLILPRASGDRAGQIVLAKVGTIKGQRVGHVGQDLRAPDRRRA